MRFVKYEEREHIAIFTINRPKALNALSTEVYQEIRQSFNNFRDNPNLWVGILTGAGDKAFSAGYDLKESIDWHKKEPINWQEYESSQTGLELWKPIIAAVNGYCLGGGFELALRCDLMIAAEHAQFGLPEVRLGEIPGDGGIQLLSRVLPRYHAAEIILTGRHITAQEAYHMGLVNRVVSLDKLLPTAVEMAELICQNAPLAIQAAKEAMIRGSDMSLEDGIELDRNLNNKLLKTEDNKEGHRAFSKRRQPNWVGK